MRRCTAVSAATSPAGSSLTSGARSSTRPPPGMFPESGPLHRRRRAATGAMLRGPRHAAVREAGPGAPRWPEPGPAAGSEPALEHEGDPVLVVVGGDLVGHGRELGVRVAHRHAVAGP